MKTKEFIEKVEELGFRAEESDSGIDVINGVFQHLCHVSKTFRFVLDTDWTEFEEAGEATREDLYKLAVEYANTPLEEREEEKKYRYKLRGVKEGSGYLNYSTDYLNYHFTSLLEVSGVTTKFTDSEVKNFPNDIKNILMLCEKIEVTP